MEQWQQVKSKAETVGGEALDAVMEIHSLNPDMESGTPWNKAIYQNG